MSAIAGATVFVLVASIFAAVSLAAPTPIQRIVAVDRGLCSFPLEVEIDRTLRTVRLGEKRVEVIGPTTVRLRNRTSGRSVALEPSGGSTRDVATGSLITSARHLWLSDKKNVPYLWTKGPATLSAPRFVVELYGRARPRVVDPCALVAEPPPSTQPAETAAPWPLPGFALSRIEYAGLSPQLGKPSRHDHMHLDVIVNGRRVTIPGGIGQAEPVDRGPGPCPPPPESRTIGDCAPGHYFTAEVAASQLQTHTSSGILHLQSPRDEVIRLGQLFDEWGVRFDSHCLGAYCADGVKELRLYVDGKRRPGDPRTLVLRQGQQIAVVYGNDFRTVPSTYRLRMQAGCGGPGERSCFPG
jgi:hypothetical protein